MMEFDTHNFTLVGDFGSDADTHEDKFTHHYSGNYYRVGFDYNLIPYSNERNMITLGMRYGATRFGDDMEIPRTSAVLGNNTYSYSNLQLEAHWFEVVNRLNVRVWQNLYFGSVIRLKMFKNVSGDGGDLVPYEIPGFGRNRKSATLDKTTTMGFSYFISYRIPFRNKPVPPKREK
jgi:hypothetical protein